MGVRLLIGLAKTQTSISLKGANHLMLNLRNLALGISPHRRMIKKKGKHTIEEEHATASKNERLNPT